VVIVKWAGIAGCLSVVAFIWTNGPAYVAAWLELRRNRRGGPS